MTDTGYLMQYFLEHSPKDDKTKTAPVSSVKKPEKKAKTEINKHE